METATIAPAGEQIEITAGDQRAVVVEIGGALRSYSAGGWDLVDGYGPDEMSSSGRGQALIPWPNRLQDGSYEFEGCLHQLPLNEPERRNAIHGLVRWVAWTASAREPHRVVMEHVLHPQPGYPFSLRLGIEYSLSDGGLQVRTTATNVGMKRCPYGSGAHPYLTLGTPTVDHLILCVPARAVLQSDERGLPTGTQAVEDTEYDFRKPRRIGSTTLDHAFTDLERDKDGVARVELRERPRSEMHSAGTSWARWQGCAGGLAPCWKPRWRNDRSHVRVVSCMPRDQRPSSDGASRYVTPGYARFN